MNNVKNSIMWADFTINPIRGLCPVDCKDNQGNSYCYARAMYKRFKWNPEIRLETGIFAPLHNRQSLKVFVGSTMELFGHWVKAEWMSYIFDCVRDLEQHTFIFLTKKPEDLARWSPFPRNCYIGVSVCENAMLDSALFYLNNFEAPIKFISFEPLLKQISLKAPELRNCKWLILGGQSGAHKFYPPEEWIQGIEEAADKAGAAVFEKQNLRKIWLKPPRREWPK